MLDEIDVRYFERRASEAHRRADAARDAANAKIHRDLAMAYERRIETLRSGYR